VDETTEERRERDRRWQLAFEPPTSPLTPRRQSSGTLAVADLTRLAIQETSSIAEDFIRADVTVAVICHQAINNFINLA
jgi:hypothetical protein